MPLLERLSLSWIPIAHSHARSRVIAVYVQCALGTKTLNLLYVWPIQLCANPQTSSVRWDSYTHNIYSFNWCLCQLNCKHTVQLHMPLIQINGQMMYYGMQRGNAASHSACCYIWGPLRTITMDCIMITIYNFIGTCTCSHFESVHLMYIISAC